MNHLHEGRGVLRLARVLGFASIVVGFALTGCSASNGTPDNDTGSGNGDSGSGGDTGRHDGSTTGVDVPITGHDASNDVDWYAIRHDGQVDPPPMYCLPDGGRATGDAGSDPFCPPDRNLQGCNCPTPGMTAPCWTGPRSARGRGSCQDGTTTCDSEEIPIWGPCVGEVDPDPTATRGPATCNCFSMGMWQIPNTSPCIVCTAQNSSGRCTAFGGAFSSVLQGMNISCGAGQPAGQPLVPAGPTWSTDSLSVDCGGTYHVCYALKAFASVANAMASPPVVTAADCTMASPCVDVVVPPGTGTQMVSPPPLPGWATTTPAAIQCATQFATNGGYAEMVVSGLSYECQDIAQGMPSGYVFNRIDYCPFACADSCPGTSCPAICAMCGNGSSGNF